MKNLLLICMLAVAAGSAARAEVLVNLNFANSADRAQVTTVGSGSGWRALGASPTNVTLNQIAGSPTNNIYNLDLNTANRFTATQSAVNISFTHFYNFQLDQSFNAMDGGTLFLGRVNNPSTSDITWTQVTSFVSGQDYNGSVPQLPNSISGFYGAGGSSGSPLTSVFTAATQAGSDYVFRFEGGLLGSSAYGSSSPAWGINTVEVVAVPEPGTLILGGVSMLIAGGGYGLRRWRKRKPSDESKVELQTTIA